MNCIFCKIIKGEIPCTKLYEDKNILTFLDINPSNEKGGHTLVLPKKHYELISDIPEEELNKVMKFVKKISTILLKEAEGVNILQNNKKIAGQMIPHIHFHIIPRYKNDNIKIDYWECKKYPPGKIELIAERIKKLL